MSEKAFMSEEIGDEYRKWKPGDVILIQAPTGVGKSHFIFYELLKYAISQKRSILYLVNRKVLKAQLEKELRTEASMWIYRETGEAIDLGDYLHISTYHYYEQRLKLNDVRNCIVEMGRYTYVVYDECHYFYTDSNFNTYTQLSYEFLRRESENKIQVFMSATMDSVKNSIKKWGPMRLSSDDSKRFNFTIDNVIFPRKTEFILDKKCDYVIPRYFRNLVELIEIIKNTEEKWLIFTDSKNKGKELVNRLKREVESDKEQIIFIDAEYDKNEETKTTVHEISEKKLASKRILITTAVMDNGISFHDKRLRNLVILADTKDEFLQMLGRKREDDQKVNLYICKRDKNYFNQRLQYTDKILRFYERYRKNFSNIYIRRYPSGELCCINGYEHLYYTAKKDLMFLDNQTKQTYSYPYQNMFACEWILSEQQKILSELFANEQNYDSASNLCYFVNGIIAVNAFSVQRMGDLKFYYMDMIKKLEANEDAFLEEQLSWMGFSKEEVQLTITEATQDIEKAHKQYLQDEIEKRLGESLTTEKVKEWKKADKRFRDGLVFFYKKSKDYEDTESKKRESTERTIARTDGTFEPAIFNICMKEAELPYELQKPSGSEFKINKLNKAEGNHAK